METWRPPIVEALGWTLALTGASMALAHLLPVGLGCWWAGLPKRPLTYDRRTPTRLPCLSPQEALRAAFLGECR